MRSPIPANAACQGPGSRLNLLLSYGNWQNQAWAELLPRLLEPMGVKAWFARSGCEAAEVIRRTPVHIAVVDLSLPLETPSAPTPVDPFDDPGASSRPPEEGGERLLDILSRLECPPPTVIVKRRRTQREDARSLSSALRAGVFAVLEPPVQLETALQVLQRVLQRHYAGRWPSN